MELVKQIRKEVGVKQYVLAERLGVNQGNYANIENGKLIPNNLEQIEKSALMFLKPLLLNKIVSIGNHLTLLRDLDKKIKI